MRTISRNRVYQGRTIGVYEETVELDSGGTIIRAVVDHPGAVVMVPLDGAGNVLLVRQPRPATEELLLELPAGTREPGEPPETTARRELREEIGHDAASLVLVGGFYSAPGFCTEYLHLYVATELQPVDGVPQDEDEDITVVPTPVTDIPDLIRSGAIKDAKSIAGLLQALFLQP